LRATTIIIVVQFGFAIIPFVSKAAWGFTSGTTRGISFSILKAELLSMTSAPALTADGANSRLLLAPAEKSAISMPLKESWVSSSTG